MRARALLLALVLAGSSAALVLPASPAIGFEVEVEVDDDDGRGPARSRATSEVDVRDNSFAPATVEIAVGDTVRWEQSGDGQHSVTADDGSFDSHDNCPPVCMQNGDDFERTFSEAGTFRYYCKLHGGEGGTGMAGRVIVRSSGGGGTGGGDDDGTDAGRSGGRARGDGSIAATGADLTTPLRVAAISLGTGLVLLTRGRRRR